MTIDVFSVKGLSGHLLKDKLEEALRANQLLCTVCLVNNVDEFIEAGLTSIPALKVGGKIFQQPSEQAFDVMIREAVDFILKNPELA